LPHSPTGRGFFSSLLEVNGATANVSVVNHVDLAGATGRFEDLHKFKVPQLRRISRLSPYFHNPIHLLQEERSALLAFLRIL
jgi:hypothetical protein